MSDATDGTTVAVTGEGRTRIPKEIREKLHIDTPGRVRFVETDDGEVVVRPVERPSELRGALATEDAENRGTTATEELREERADDRAETDDRYGLERDG